MALTWIAPPPGARIVMRIIFLVYLLFRRRFCHCSSRPQPTMQCRCSRWRHVLVTVRFIWFAIRMAAQHIRKYGIPRSVAAFRRSLSFWMDRRAGVLLPHPNTVWSMCWTALRNFRGNTVPPSHAELEYLASVPVSRGSIRGFEQYADQAPPGGTSMVHVAASQGLLSCLTSLVDFGASYDDKPCFLHCPTREKVAGRMFREIQRARVSKKGMLRNCGCTYDNTPWSLAVKNGHFDAARFLMRRGARMRSKRVAIWVKQELSWELVRYRELVHWSRAVLRQRERTGMTELDWSNSMLRSTLAGMNRLPGCLFRLVVSYI